MIGRFALGGTDLRGTTVDRRDGEEQEKWARSQQERYLKEVAQENIDEFDMSAEEAYEDALAQLKSQFGERLRLTRADVRKVLSGVEATGDTTNSSK